jgi:hypothetical protein
MQLPTIDRISNLRPVAVESASLATGRVVPVAPVNPSTQSVPAAEPSPSVVNLINQTDKPSFGEGVYSSVSDPSRRGANADTSAKDWTIQRPAPEKVQDPPPVPLSKMLMDQIKSLWAASASAVQVQTQVKNQVDVAQTGANATPGALSAEVFTYSPSKINKAEKPKS